MALRPPNWLLPGGVLLAMGLSDALAQEGSSSTIPVEESPASDSGVGDVGPLGEPLPSDLTPRFQRDPAQVGSTDQAGAPDARFAQMLEEADTIRKKIESLSESVSHMLREARNASDVVQQMCLDDKLNQIDVAGQSAESSIERMKAAAASGDAGEMQRGYAVMQALGEGTSLLSGEANQCIGEQKKFVGGASLNVTVDPEIPRSDTTGGEVAVPPTTVPNTVDIQPPLTGPPDPVSPVM